MPIARSTFSRALPGSSRARWVSCWIEERPASLWASDQRILLLHHTLFHTRKTFAPKELAALHEILTWGREPNNNPVLRFFGSTFEDFSDACRTLAAKWKHLLATGNNRVRVRMTGKDKVHVKETTLGSTLGEESTGLFFVSTMLYAKHKNPRNAPRPCDL